MSKKKNEGKDVFETALDVVHDNPLIVGTVAGGLLGRKLFRARAKRDAGPDWRKHKGYVGGEGVRGAVGGGFIGGYIGGAGQLGKLVSDNKNRRKKSK